VRNEQRRDHRYRVHIGVKYGIAEQFVADYAENLSIGGLFIEGAHNLQLYERVEFEIDLPGLGHWRVVAKTVCA